MTWLKFTTISARPPRWQHCEMTTRPRQVPLSIHSIECLDCRICFVEPSAALEDYAACQAYLIVQKGSSWAVSRFS